MSLARIVDTNPDETSFSGETFGTLNRKESMIVQPYYEKRDSYFLSIIKQLRRRKETD